MEKKVWVTMMTNNNEKYLKGILTVAYSLCMVKSKYKLVVLYTSVVNDNIKMAISKLPNCELRYTEMLKPSSKIKYALPHFGEVWTKLRIFNLTDYEKIVWIDADMLVLRNMDELFDVEVKDDVIGVCADCLCNPCGYKDFPYFQHPDYCFFNNREKKMNYFNAGLIVLKPNEKIFTSIIQRMEDWDLSKMVFAEQDFLNKFFDGKIIMMSSIYNSFQGFLKTHPEKVDFSKIKNIHYAGIKPWDYDINEESTKKHEFYPLFVKWWENFEKAEKFFNSLKTT